MQDFEKQLEDLFLEIEVGNIDNARAWKSWKKELKTLFKETMKRVVPEEDKLGGIYKTGWDQCRQQTLENIENL